MAAEITASAALCFKNPKPEFHAGLSPTALLMCLLLASGAPTADAAAVSALPPTATPSEDGTAVNAPAVAAGLPAEGRADTAPNAPGETAGTGRSAKRAADGAAEASQTHKSPKKAKADAEPAAYAATAAAAVAAMDLEQARQNGAQAVTPAAEGGSGAAPCGPQPSASELLVDDIQVRLSLACDSGRLCFYTYKCLSGGQHHLKPGSAVQPAIRNTIAALAYPSTAGR